MAIAHVQTPAGGVANASATSVALAFASNVTAGSMIVVGWRYSVGARTVTVTDSQGNTYANVVESINTNDGNSTQGISYAMNCAAGATTVTFAISGGALNLRMACSEFSGAATSGAADQSASAIGTATNFTTATVTPSSDGQVFFYVVHTQADDLITAGTDFTEGTKVPTGAANRLQIEYYVQPTAAAHVGNATGTASSISWGCAVATFRPAGAAVGQVSPGPSRVGGGPGGRFARHAFQWVQQFGAEASTAVDLRQGTATAYLAVWSTTAGTKIAGGAAKAAVTVEATEAGTKLASGAAKAPVAVSAKQAGTKLTGGGAVAHVAVWAKQAGSKIISGTASAAVSVFAKQSGTKVAQGNAKAAVTVETSESGTKIGQGNAKAGIAVAAREAGTKTAQGSGKASVTVWVREAASKITDGTAKAAVAVWAPVAGSKVGGAVEGAAIAVISVLAKAAGSKVGQGSAKAAVTVAAKQAGTHIGSGAAKAAITVEAKQAGVKIGSGSGKASVATHSRAAASKLAQGVAKAALAVWSRLTGTVVDLTLSAGTGETFLAGPWTATTLVKVGTVTVLEPSGVATGLAGPWGATELVPVEVETDL